ncbi:MAG: RNA polymerase sigma factor [Armatimonadota bacterium]
MAVLTWDSLQTLRCSGERGKTLEFDFDFDSIREFIFKLSYSLTLDYSLAEDLAQDCLIKVWQHQHRLHELHSAEAWIAKVVTNKARNYWKRKPNWLPLMASVPAPGEQDPTLIELRELIAGLKQEYRDVILLVAVYGYTYAEAGQTLDVPEGTVASRFSAAKKQLQYLMGDES